MKNVPKCCIIGLLISIVIFIISVVLYSNNNEKDKVRYEEKEAIIIDASYTTRVEADEHRHDYTTATIEVDGETSSVELDGHDYYKNDKITVYKYKDKYYQTVDAITIEKNPLIFVVMTISIFGSFIFFPFQIISYSRTNKKDF